MVRGRRGRKGRPRAAVRRGGKRRARGRNGMRAGRSRGRRRGVAPGAIAGGRGAGRRAEGCEPLRRDGAYGHQVLDAARKLLVRDQAVRPPPGARLDPLRYPRRLRPGAASAPGAAGRDRYRPRPNQVTDAARKLLVRDQAVRPPPGARPDLLGYNDRAAAGTGAGARPAGLRRCRRHPAFIPAWIDRRARGPDRPGIVQAAPVRHGVVWACKPVGAVHLRHRGRVEVGRDFFLGFKRGARGPSILNAEPM